MKSLERHPNTVKWFIATGCLLAAGWGVGLILMRFIPPSSPTASPREIADLYANNITQVRIGIALLLLASTFWATWGCAIVTMIRRMDGQRTTLANSLLALAGTGTALFMVCVMCWAIASFRAGAIDPEITITFHDAGWLAALISDPPFALTYLLVGIAVLSDTTQPLPVYPRWFGYLSIYAAFGQLTAVVVFAFHTGPLAYNGVLGFWIPAVLGFGWMVVITILTFKSVDRLVAQEEASVADMLPIEAEVRRLEAPTPA